MSPTESRTGFRLPWSTDGRTQSEEHDAPEAEAATEASPGDDATTDGVAMQTEASDNAGNDRSTADGTTPAVLGAHPDEAQPDMEVQQVFPSVDAPADHVQDHATTSVRGGEHQRAHRPEKFLADLTRAMQAAAEAARDQSLGQFETDSKQFVDEIQARSAEEAAELRQESEHDIAATREWSKAEMARIREETEARIAQRRSQLDGDLEAHAELVQARIGRVNQRLEAYRAEMADFFEQLLAVDDPARFAALAEQMPEPPTLEDAWLEDETRLAGAAAVAVGDSVDHDGAPGTPIDAPAAGEAAVDAAATSGTWPTSDTGEAASGRAFDFGAAEAEAAAVTTTDVDQGDGSDEEVPDISDSISARLAGLITPDGSQDATGDGPEAAGPAAAVPATTQVIVSGLVSVASIAGFKRQLARVAGVGSVTVSSGPDGEFVFTATHDPDTLLAGDVAAFSGFEARVTDASDGVLRVTARDPEA